MLLSKRDLGPGTVIAGVNQVTSIKNNYDLKKDSDPLQLHFVPFISNRTSKQHLTDIDLKLI